MKKEEQKKINRIVLSVLDRIGLDGTPQYTDRLRSCSAKVYETEHFYLLLSYNTFICAIEKETKYVYDFLRYVYGYTSTSAQHISKFMRDYAGSFFDAVRLTYREV